MSATTIEWTDAVWNPVRGCSLVSAGCQRCYAMRQAHRFSKPGMAYEGLTQMTSHGPVWTGKARPVPEMLLVPWHWSKPRRIFVNSMSDLFHEDVPFEFIAQVFWIMSVTTRHTYQILTKRPQRMLDFFKWAHGDYDPTVHGGWFADARIKDEGHKLDVEWTPWREDGRRGGYDNCGPGWPYENVWLGVSVENQPTAEDRIAVLLQTPAAVRWISAEPLLDPIHFKISDDKGNWANLLTGRVGKAEWGPLHPLPGLNWVVVGGESGPGARPFDMQWARSIVAQCREANVPVFVKQLGARPVVDRPSDRINLPLRYKPGISDDERGAYIRLDDRAGGDMSEWPEDLRVREYPA